VSKLVVIGNGPSLKGFDFTRLNGVATLGMNAAYRYWDQIDWYPTIYTCMDDKVTQTHHQHIKRLIDEGRIKYFFLTRFMLDYYPELKYDARIFFLEQFNENHKYQARKYDLNLIESPFFKSSTPAKITTGSCAVRFGCFLGYTSISIIGVDLEYQEVIQGVSRREGIGLEITQKITNNPNYFFDGYQEAGDSFNIPNPAHLGDLHFDVFKILADDLRSLFWPVSLYNSNRNSKLFQKDVFQYKELDEFLARPAATPAVRPAAAGHIGDIRILVLDPTHIGHQSATGQIKSLFFRDASPAQVAQICVKFDGSGICGAIGLERINANDFTPFASQGEIIAFAQDFAPDVIYYRPIDSVLLHETACALKEQLDIPVVSHLMDDWVLRHKDAGASEFRQWEERMLGIVSMSSELLAISQKMADAYGVRYGGKWQVLANGIDLKSYPLPEKASRTKKIIRYMGGAAEDMNYSAIVQFAKTIEHNKKLASQFTFEIYTMPWYIKSLGKALDGFKTCQILELVEVERYGEILRSADALLITYNFDSTTEKYVSLSMANKMPECLASGVPVIAYGPSTIATIELLEKYGLAHVVNQEDATHLEKVLTVLASNSPITQTIAQRARSFAAHFLSADAVVAKFNQALLAACATSAGSTDGRRALTHDILDAEEQLTPQNLSLQYANECLANGLYARALAIYFKILPQLEFMRTSIEFNISLAFRRLGYGHIDPGVIRSRFL
jgi:glycosyltransferase involved in cell wall biosynthesis